MLAPYASVLSVCRSVAKKSNLLLLTWSIASRNAWFVGLPFFWFVLKCFLDEKLQSCYAKQPYEERAERENRHVQIGRPRWKFHFLLACSTSIRALAVALFVVTDTVVETRWVARFSGFETRLNTSLSHYNLLLTQLSQGLGCVCDCTKGKRRNAKCNEARFFDHILLK